MKVQSGEVVLTVLALAAPLYIQWVTPDLEAAGMSIPPPWFQWTPAMIMFGAGWIPRFYGAIRRAQGGRS